MGFAELFLLAVGLSMDAFAVAIGIGLGMEKHDPKKALTVGLYFGFFQAAMPLAGFFAAKQFAAYVTAYSHWIAFALLLFLGSKMIIESLKKESGNEGQCPPSLAQSRMLPLAIATSIDALAVGVSLAFLQTGIIPAVSFIGLVTFAISAGGVFIGSIAGAKLKSKATFTGGIILILVGVRILVSGLR